MREGWQIEQGSRCPCGGSDDYCGCQNERPGDKLPSSDELLDWMTYHHLPLHLFREEEGGWVVVDASTDEVKGSGATALWALVAAHEKESV